MPKDRLSIWVPKEDRWLLSAFVKLQKGFQERGIPMSISALVISVIKKGLEEYARDSDDKI